MVPVEVAVSEGLEVQSGSKVVDGAGRSAIFRKLNSEWGVKLYKNEKLRDIAYRNQKLAAEHMLGPQVGDSFDLPIAKRMTREVEVSYRYIRSSDFRFGYVTELAQVMTEDEYEEMEYEIGELQEELSEIGFDFTDALNINMGWIDGRLVCIDFAEGD